MKNLLFTFTMILLSTAYSCSGPSGPPGPQGPRGQDGEDGLLAEVFEVNANFNEGNNFSAFYELDPPLFDSDMLMVYILWNFFEDEPIWRPLPLSQFFPEGILQYDYNFTRFDFEILMDGNIPLTELGSEFTSNQVFRVVVIPGYMLEKIDDVNNYEEVKRVMNLTEEDFM